jgi:hypothetical protein
MEDIRISWAQADSRRPSVKLARSGQVIAERDFLDSTEYLEWKEDFP